MQVIWNQVAKDNSWTYEVGDRQEFNEAANCQEYIKYVLKVKVRESCNRPDVVQRVPEGLGSPISWH
jgi:hypothetical protein